MVAANGGGRLRHAPQMSVPVTGSAHTGHTARNRGSATAHVAQISASPACAAHSVQVCGNERRRLRAVLLAIARHPRRAAQQASTALSNAAVAGFDMDRSPPRNSDSIVAVLLVVARRRALCNGPPDHRQALFKL